VTDRLPRGLHAGHLPDGQTGIKNLSSSLITKMACKFSEPIVVTKDDIDVCRRLVCNWAAGHCVPGMSWRVMRSKIRLLDVVNP